MKKKKLMYLCLCSLLSLCLIGCGKDKKESTEIIETEDVSETITTEEETEEEIVPIVLTYLLSNEYVNSTIGDFKTSGGIIKGLVGASNVAVDGEDSVEVSNMILGYKANKLYRFEVDSTVYDSFYQDESNNVETFFDNCTITMEQTLDTSVLQNYIGKSVDNLLQSVNFNITGIKTIGEKHYITLTSATNIDGLYLFVLEVDEDDTITTFYHDYEHPEEIGYQIDNTEIYNTLKDKKIKGIYEEDEVN